MLRSSRKKATHEAKLTTGTKSSPLTIQRRFAGKRVQNTKGSKSKPSTKKQEAARQAKRDVKDLIRSTNSTTDGTTETSSSTTKRTSRTTPSSTFLKPGPVISAKKLHPTMPQALVSKVPSPQSLSQTVDIANPTAQHVKVNPTAQVKALQDPILMNQGQGLVLNNDGKPYFKYGLCRTIKLPPNPSEIQQSITKRQQQVQEAKGFTNAKDRIRDHCMRRLQLAVQIFLNRLDSATNSIPTVLTLLHPFEYELATITLAQHAHDSPIPFHILKELPVDDSNILLQYVLLQESRVDHQYDEHIDAQKLARIAHSLTRYRELYPNKANPHSDDFNLNYINFLQDENYQVVDGFTNLRAKGTLYYSTILYNMNKCRELVIHHYYKYKKLLNAAAMPQDMHDVSKKEIADMEKLIKSPLFTTTMDLFRQMTLLLKSQHWIDPNIPTLLCVGAPNVGKSSLVRALSTSKTQVQSYRFTTRKLTMGHLDVNGFACQVTDSPGLLPRPDEDRNAMEALTIAAIKHLPLCGVAFVIDPTVQGGVSLQHQLLLRNELRWRFGKVLGSNWVDVATKADLWSSKYGIRKNTLPMTDPQLFTYDEVSVRLYNDEKNRSSVHQDGTISNNDDRDEGIGDEDDKLSSTVMNVDIEPVITAPKKRGRPRKNPDATTSTTNNTSPTQLSVKTPTTSPILSSKKKESGITPHWTLSQSLDELQSILPTPPSDIIPGLVQPSGQAVSIPLPYFTLSTVHLRDVHNETQNMQLKGRFLRNKKVRKAEEEKNKKAQGTQEAERHRVGSSTYQPMLYEVGEARPNASNYEEHFDSLTFEEYEQWWDNLSTHDQKIYLQAINDTETVNGGISKVLARMVTVVEKEQAQQQFLTVQEQRDNDTINSLAMRENLTLAQKRDDY